MAIEQFFLETEVNSKVGDMIKDVNQQTDPRFASITDIAIQRRAQGPWYKVDVNMIELLQIMQTGEYDEDKITAVRVLEIKLDTGEEVHFIYDFILLHTERNPWRMV
jgi:hypothetical protein